MPVPEIQSEALKWQRRIAMLGNAGLQTGPATELARTDLSRIAQGGSPLPEQQIISMVHSAYTGSVNTPTNQGGTDWNPMDIAGNAFKDIGMDVRSFVPGLVHTATDAVNPSKWEQLGGALANFKTGSISDMAKEVQALPIIGPLVPGMFALSAGTSGMTQHPLNFMLDVAAVASVGTKLASLPMEAGVSETIDALKAGHPLEAVMKSTGMEQKLIDSLAKSGASPYIQDLAKMGKYTSAIGLGKTPLKDSQWAYMPVWRAYNALARMETRRLRDNGLHRLDAIIPKEMSDSERQQLVTDAQNFDTRYLAPAEEPNLQQIAGAGGDPRNAFAGISGDVQAFSTTDPATNYPSDIYFTQQEAQQAIDAANMPDELKSQFPIYNVRVPTGAISFNDKTGKYHADTGILPNKFYTHKQAEILRQIREFTDGIDIRKLAEGDKSPEAVIIPTGLGGPNASELYPRDSMPYKLQLEYHKSVDTYASAAKKLVSAQETVSKAKQNFVKVTAQHKAGKATDAAANAAKARVDAAQRVLSDRAKVVQAAVKARDQAMQNFQNALIASPTGRWSPLVTSMVRSRLKESIKQKLMASPQGARVALVGAGISGGLDELRQYYEALTKIDNAKTAEELSAAVGADTLKTVEQNALNDWTQLVKAGYDPIFIHHIERDWYEKKVFASIRPRSQEMSVADRGVVFDFSPQVLDIHAQLTEQAINFYRTEATKQFIDFLANKSGMVYKTTDLRADLEKRFPNNEVKQEEMLSEYDKWKNPHDPEHEYMVAKGMERGLMSIMEDNKLPLKALRTPVHRIFRVAVLTGPRHMVHVALGGLMQVVLQDPGAFTQLEVLGHPIALMKGMREGHIPSELTSFHEEMTKAIQTGELTKGQYETQIDQLVAYRGGNKIGRWWRESAIGHGVHDVERRINNFENSITDMYRAAIYLDKMKHGATNEAALAAVNKILIDVDNMTPFERGVIREVFPFWTFTKHILRYVLSYPADHPLRASILAHLAKNMEDGQSSGDPARLSKLFFLGQPDHLGKVTTVDFSNFNPFRSMSSIFSMAGFLSGLAPEYQMGMQMYGINTLTGAPSLHQNLTYDAYTGTQTTTRPPFDPLNYISLFIPQTEIIDHFVQFSDTMRYLKKNNPEAYQRSLFVEMNLPFTVQPLNIYDVRAKAAAAQYRQANDAVSNAMRTGNTDPLRNFLAVPFEGQLYPGDQIANYIDNFDQLFPGFAPKAVIRKPRRRRTVL